MYRFAYIADDKTIVWGSSKKSIELAIDAGTKGPESADWYKLWREFSGNHFSVALNERPAHVAPIPGPISSLKKVKAAAGGMNVSKRTIAKAKAICLSAADAQEAADSVKEALKMSLTALEAQQQRMKRRGMEVGLDFMADLLKSAKVKTNQKTVQIESSFKIDFTALAKSFEATHLAAKRTQAANNLRQTVLAFHNFESNGKAPFARDGAQKRQEIQLAHRHIALHRGKRALRAIRFHAGMEQPA